jgi:hypothetical protein
MSNSEFSFQHLKNLTFAKKSYSNVLKGDQGVRLRARLSANLNNLASRLRLWGYFKGYRLFTSLRTP